MTQLMTVAMTMTMIKMIKMIEMIKMMSNLLAEAV